MGPYGRMKQQGYPINLIYPEGVDWTVLSRCNAVFMLRPYTLSHMKIINQAKDWGLPVIVDYDDDLLNVPESNPAFATYSNEETKSLINTVLCVADAITVSTDELAKSFGASNAITIKNAIDPRMFKRRANDASRDLIIWRGSRTHDEDLLTEMESIRLLSEEHEIIFIGEPAWQIRKELGNKSNVGFFKPLELETYFLSLRALAPRVLIAPLADNAFNKSKSDISHMEASFAGAAYVGRSKTFYSDVKALMRDPIEARRQSDASWEKFTTERSLDDANELRWNLLTSLTKGDKHYV
jgi:spore maturation protein CgeB